MLIVAIHTGLRRGEICGLRWQDVDNKNKLLHVRRQITRTDGGAIESDLKTESSKRDVELTDLALEAILNQPKRSEYVFTTESGKPCRPDTFGRDFKLLVKDTDFAKVKLHDLRASYISLLLSLGTDVRTVQELAGHSSCAMTVEVYARSHRKLKRAAADRLNEALSS